MKFSRLLFSIVSLTVIWIVLRENISVFDVIMGIVAGTACLLFAQRFLPSEEVDNVKFHRIITYPFWLLGQIYLSGFFVIRMIIFGARADFVPIKTKLDSNIMRVILGNSITLVPGSITLDQNKNKYTVVLMRDKDASDPEGDMSDIVKGKLEARLIKAEK
jgi:multicomponent Na+:H+ antiporter subunit E